MLLDQVTPPYYFFGTLLTASVVLAVLAYTPLGVACTGAVGCLVLALTEAFQDNVGPLTVTTLIVLVVVTVLSVALCVLRFRMENRFRRVQTVAEVVQLALMRPLPPHVGPVKMAGFYRAADDEALIGGDLYSVRRTPFGIRVIVGDVRGKGIDTTQTLTTVLSTFREAALLQPTLPQLADRIDTALRLDRDNADLYPAVSDGLPVPASPKGAEDAVAPEDEVFVTAVLLEFPWESHEVRILDRGHQPLLLVGSGEVAVVKTEHSLPLGMGDLLVEQPRTATHTMRPGDTLIAYSDGVTEARDHSGAFYPLRTRLQAHCDSSPQPSSPDDVIDFLQRDLARWAPALTDDVVAIALQPVPPAQDR
ncbi:PP2C family protein-serine/threonine phosphatase [Streptomyces sp. DH8]|uniref:PP2C family protein-serine/threonine phosphatase n=1 Tax=Streptomyces sp. DH8 TaxID=2857008 RepID=UPI001E64B049|nr:PP2C family protein-serine/threonine phosphatase [Streptomyces sp. DH8]